MNENKCDALKIENQACFPLYACSREVIKCFTPYLTQMDLTYTQYITMMVLWEKQSVTAKELGERLYLDSGTLTPLLKKLESKGMITRKRSQEDERNLIVTITEAGAALKETAVALQDEMEQCIQLPEEEKEMLYHLLNKALAGCGHK